MRSMRWNWLVLVVLGASAVFIGVAGLLVGAFGSSTESILFLTLGIAFIVGGFLMREWYKPYETEAIATAESEFTAERETT
jgi:hypothetical protein